MGAALAAELSLAAACLARMQQLLAGALRQKVVQEGAGSAWVLLADCSGGHHQQLGCGRQHRLKHWHSAEGSAGGFIASV
mmetsp:Transcript_11202/g.33608  ORF Transcript_11202/g.33608 Transcript_11202/m.33608 type:complete len:80 (+) Transcript_11202:509-748(+)